MFIVPLRGYILPAAAAAVLVALSFNKAHAQEHQSGWQQRWQSFKQDVIEPTRKAVTPLVDKAKVALQHMSRDVPPPRPLEGVDSPSAILTLCETGEWATLRTFGNSLKGEELGRFTSAYLIAHKGCVDGADHAVVAKALDELFWLAESRSKQSIPASDGQKAARILLEQFSEAEPDDEAPAAEAAEAKPPVDGTLMLHFMADGTFTVAIPEVNKKAVCVPAEVDTVCTIIMGDGTVRKVTYHTGITRHALNNLIANAGLN